MQETFGRAADGSPARLFTLTGTGGLQVRVCDLGATLVALHLPDRHGNLEDVVLGFDSIEGYQSRSNMYFGATVGRVANRIAGAGFSMGGHHYRLASNEPPHHLHGGADRSFSRVMWEVGHVADDVVELSYVSPAGEEGYPGRLEASARYRLRPDGLEVVYRATTDATTPVNLTNHTYWNLAGAGNGTILDNELQIMADTYTPTDEELIPTGVIADVAGTPLDLREPVRVGARIGELRSTGARGYDHNFVLNGPADTVRLAARLRDPDSGRVMELHTNQPAVQFYSGNRLRGQTGKDGRSYEVNGALCLEPQRHPDAVHHPGFPSILLEPGETYEHVSTFVFGSDGEGGTRQGTS